MSRFNLGKHPKTGKGPRGMKPKPVATALEIIAMIGTAFLTKKESYQVQLAVARRYRTVFLGKMVDEMTRNPTKKEEDELKEIPR